MPTNKKSSLTDKEKQANFIKTLLDHMREKNANIGEGRSKREEQKLEREYDTWIDNYLEKLDENNGN